jgi:hypothetical protein
VVDFKLAVGGLVTLAAEKAYLGAIVGRYFTRRVGVADVEMVGLLTLHIFFKEKYVRG